MPYRFIYAFLIASLLAVPIFADAQAADSQTVLARVGDAEITLGHVILMRTRLPEEYRSLPDSVLLNALLDQLIQQAALAQAFESSGDPLPNYVALSLDNERRGMLSAAEQGRIVDRALTESAIEAAFERRYKEFNASHVIVSDEQQAKQVVAALRGGAPFELLARQYASSPPGSTQFELGWFELDEMVPEFSAAVRRLAIGDISEPVQTQFGWHIIRLNNVRTKDGVTLETPGIRSELLDVVRSQAIESALYRLQEKYAVQRLTDGIDPAMIRRTDLIQD